uniref:Uncharacterized protein n=1 Tax=Ascaris lumbricoides TaxID=6252 RepID=A0A0M3I7V1_ASCLU
MHVYHTRGVYRNAIRFLCDRKFILYSINDLITFGDHFLAIVYATTMRFDSCRRVGICVECLRDFIAIVNYFQRFSPHIAVFSSTSLLPFNNYLFFPFLLSYFSVFFHFFVIKFFNLLNFSIIFLINFIAYQ